MDHWIVPGGAGTWVKGALWDEVVVRIENRSIVPIEIMSVELIDPRGIYIEAGVTTATLQSRTEALQGTYRDAGIAVAIGMAPAVVTGAAIGAGSIGTAAAVAAAAPVAIVAAPIYYFYRKHAKEEDRSQIEQEFIRRNLPRLTLAPGGSVSGSKFFPVVPNPRRLVISYRVGAEIRQIGISLGALQGLHVATTR